MPEQKSLFVAILLILGLSLVVIGCVSEAPSSPENGEHTEIIELIESKCITCHALSRVYSVKSQEQWPQIVSRMIDYSPGLLEEHEAEQVIEYLIINYSE